MSLTRSDSPASARQTAAPQFRKPLSVVYVEDAALSHPRTVEILAKLPGATVIRCRDYRDVFNRPHQEPALQKEAQALILAVSDRPRLYEGAPVCQDFGNRNFYYTSDVMNCVFDCEYCYLQGMYPSGHIVVFVNLEDTFRGLDEVLSAKQSAYVCISYDTDLLAFEPLLGYVGKWISFAAERPNLTLELRTKSASASVLRALPVTDRVILALTLSPDTVIRTCEHRTPTLAARLALANEAIDLGWKVRLCFDPILAVHDAKAVYNDMFDEVFRTIPMDRVLDASVGLFRISKEYLKEMRRHRPCAVTCYPYKLNDGVYHYPDMIGKPLTELAIARLTEFLPRERIALWDGTD